MSFHDVAALVLHQAFASIWVGSVVFVALTTVPRAKDAEIGPDAADAAVGTLQTIARTSAAVLLLTGLWALYSVTWDGSLAIGTLVESTRGLLLLAMVVLWLLLIGTVEVGAARFRDGLAEDKLREPARRAQPWLRGAAVLAILVSAVAGLLTAGVGA